MQFNIETGSNASWDLRVAFLGFCIRKGYLSDENGQPKVQLGEEGLELSFEADAHEVLKELPDNISGDERFPLIVEISGYDEYGKILRIMLDIQQRNFKVVGCKVDTEGKDGSDTLDQTKLELTFEASIAALEKHLIGRETLVDSSKSVKPPKAKAEKTPPDKEKLEELMNIVRTPGTTEMMMLKNVGDFLGIAGEGEDIAGEKIVILLQAYTEPRKLTSDQRKELGEYLAPVFGNNRKIASTMSKIRKVYEATHPKDNTHPEGGDQKGCNPEPDADKEDHHT